MIRGAKADYDEWEDLGNKGWSWKDVLPLFKKVREFPLHYGPSVLGVPLQTPDHP